MKFFTRKLFSLLMLASIFAGKIQADRYLQNNAECCRESCYECSCNPLYCGAFDLQLQAGIAPIIWTDRGEFDFVECAGVAPVNPITKLFNVPKFDKFFHLPWIIGGQIGYAASDNIRFYLEFNYLQASAKKNVGIVTIDAVPNTIVFSNKKYKLFEAYLGGRYYWDRWCDKLSVFVGLKAGLTRHKRTNFSATITPPVPAVALITNLSLFKYKTVPSGGLEIGLDYCICGNWALVLTADMVASCGPKGAGNIPFGQPAATCSQIGFQPSIPQPIAGVNNLLIGGVGAEIRFPITAAVRYVW